MFEGSECMTRTRMAVFLGRWLMWLALFLPAAVYAQQSLGTPSNQPPNEDLYVYKELPDIEIQSGGTVATRLSTIWQNKPVLLTMIFTRCTGVCSAFLGEKASIEGGITATWSGGRPSQAKAARENTKASASLT